MHGCEKNNILLTMIMITRPKCYKNVFERKGQCYQIYTSNEKINNCDTRFEMTTLLFNVKDYIQTITL